MSKRIRGTIYMSSYEYDGMVPQADNHLHTGSYSSDDVTSDETAMITAWQLRNPDPKVAARNTFGIVLVPKWKAWVMKHVLRINLHAEK